MNLNLDNLSRDHLFTIFSFCSTPYLGNLTQVCKNLSKEVNAFFPIRYPNGQYEALKSSYEIKKAILKKIEKKESPKIFTVKMACTHIDRNTKLFLEPKGDFYIFYSGKIKVLNLREANTKDIKICVKTSAVFGFSSIEDIVLVNSKLINATPSQLYLTDSTSKIDALFHVATQTVQIATEYEMLFQNSDIIISYDKNKIEIVEIKSKKPLFSYDFSNLIVSDFKNGILIIGNKEGKLVSIDVEKRSVLFEKKFNSLFLVEIIDNQKFILQIEKQKKIISICECKTGNNLFELNLSLEESGLVFGPGKFIRTNLLYSQLCIVDLEARICKEVKIEFSKFNLDPVSDKHLVLTSSYLQSNKGRSGIILYDSSSSTIIATHYFQGNKVIVKVINQYLCAVMSGNTGRNFLKRDAFLNYTYGILELRTGKYHVIKSDKNQTELDFFALEANEHYLAYCTSSNASSNVNPEFKIQFHSLMDEVKSLP